MDHEVQRRNTDLLHNSMASQKEGTHSIKVMRDGIITILKLDIANYFTRSFRHVGLDLPGTAVLSIRLVQELHL